MRPMLAARPKRIEDVVFPVYGSYKYDGIRSLVLPEKGLVSRRLTPIKNKHLRETYCAAHGFEGLDGELFLPMRFGDFHKGSGIVRSASDPGAVQIEFAVFDKFTAKGPFYKRYEAARLQLARANPFCSSYLIEHVLLEDINDLLEFEEQALAEKFEGVMLRHPEGPYKSGRSTMNEQWLMKLKRFTDAEAKIIGFKEQMKNNNTATTDALGKTKRSRHQANMVGKDTLGAFECVGLNGPFKGVEFDIAGGSKQEGAISFDNAFRDEVWRNQKKYLNRTITYTYFEPGSRDAPRHAGLYRFRDGGL